MERPHVRGAGIYDLLIFTVIHALLKTDTKFTETEKHREKWRRKQNKA